MKRLLLVLSLVALSGCAAIETVIKQVPSFNDPNQSSSIVRVQVLADNIDCLQPQYPQAQALQLELQYFIVYSQNAGIRHHDVIDLVTPLKETVDDWATRTKTGSGSMMYCSIKKGIIQEDAHRAAKVVLGRF